MRSFPIYLAITCMFTLGCNHADAPLRDQPRLTAGVHLEDVRFHSNALAHEAVYRILTPAAIPANTKVPVVWLLHGAGTSYTDWTNSSDIAAIVPRGVILVMPFAENSFYLNSATHKDQQYEDFLVQEVIPNFRQHAPFAAADRAHNAVIGISRGGFGAVVIALRHPQLFSYIASLSGALDLAERPFRWHQFGLSNALRRTFAPSNTLERKREDPFSLVQQASAPMPYVYLACGDADVLLSTNQRFATLLRTRNIPFEFHVAKGGHNWDFWNSQLPAVETSILQHFGVPNSQQATHS